VVTGGTMTIATFTSTGASGTFSFTATGNPPRAVTRGEFTVAF
jgi:hypothetical protein